MRILIYDVAADSGGAMTVLNSFYEDFCKDRDNEYIFVLSVCKLREMPHIKVLRYPWIKKSPLHRLYFDHILAGRLVKKYKADQILSLQNIELPHTRIPQTVYEHNALPFSEYRFHPWEAFRPWFTQQILGRMMKRSIRHAEKVMVQTNWMKEEIVRQCKIAEDKVEIRFPEVEMLKTSPWHIDTNKPVFFYPANASAYKNHRTFLRACELLQKNGYQKYEVIWTVTGDENENIRRIRKEAVRQNLPVTFRGHMTREALFELYACSVLVFPSYIETVGLPLLEAKSVGAWILAADCRYARDIIAGYEKADYFDMFDAKALYKKMRRFIGKQDKNGTG